jgi:hypothetical protein
VGPNEFKAILSFCGRSPFGVSWGRGRRPATAAASSTCCAAVTTTGTSATTSVCYVSGRTFWIGFLFLLFFKIGLSPFVDLFLIELARTVFYNVTFLTTVETRAV